MRLDNLIKTLAKKHGEPELSEVKVAEVRKRLETAYLNSLLDGAEPFCTNSQGADDDNGKT